MGRTRTSYLIPFRGCPLPNPATISPHSVALMSILPFKTGCPSKAFVLLSFLYCYTCVKDGFATHFYIGGCNFFCFWLFDVSKAIVATRFEFVELAYGLFDDRRAGLFNEQSSPLFEWLVFKFVVVVSILNPHFDKIIISSTLQGTVYYCFIETLNKLRLFAT